MIGVLALQGGFDAHCRHLDRLGRPYHKLRLPHQLQDTSGLILPGGESTTMLKLMRNNGFIEAITAFAHEGKPILGTCAGAILLCRDVIHPRQESLGLLDATIERNAYGCQRESFETFIDLPDWDLVDLPVYFIRAPKFTRTGANTRVLSRHGDDITGVIDGSVTAVTYHPELSDDSRFHRAWIDRYF